jgi:hypothetical protein
MRKMVEEMGDSEPGGQPFVEKYIAALGITEDEYWSEYAVKAYQEALSIGKLRGKVLNEHQANKNANTKGKLASEDNKLQMTSKNSEELNDVWNNYQKSLFKKAKVESLQLPYSLML